jgi:hypothetical protein
LASNNHFSMTLTAGTTNVTTRRTLPVKEMIGGLHITNTCSRLPGSSKMSLAQCTDFERSILHNISSPRPHQLRAEAERKSTLRDQHERHTSASHDSACISARSRSQGVQRASDLRCDPQLLTGCFCVKLVSLVHFQVVTFIITRTQPFQFTQGARLGDCLRRLKVAAVIAVSLYGKVRLLMR